MSSLKPRPPEHLQQKTNNRYGQASSQERSYDPRRLSMPLSVQYGRRCSGSCCHKPCRSCQEPRVGCARGVRSVRMKSLCPYRFPNPGFDPCGKHQGWRTPGSNPCGKDLRGPSAFAAPRRCTEQLLGGALARRLRCVRDRGVCCGTSTNRRGRKNCSKISYCRPESKSYGRTSQDYRLRQARTGPPSTRRRYWA